MIVMFLAWVLVGMFVGVNKAEAATKFKIATYNIMWGYQLDCRLMAIKNFVKDENIDILATEETYGYVEAGYPSSRVNSLGKIKTWLSSDGISMSYLDGADSSSSILSRYSFDVGSTGNVPGARARKYKVNVNGEEVWFFVIHSNNVDEATKIAQGYAVTNAANLITDTAVIVLGDFNIPRSYALYSDIKAMGFTEACEAKGSPTCSDTVNLQGHDYAIDFIFFRSNGSGLNLLNAYAVHNTDTNNLICPDHGGLTMYNKPSDHFPVVAEFEISTSLPCVTSTGDANSDGFVDIADGYAWYQSYKSNYVRTADFNCDGLVNIQDGYIWYSNFE